MTYIAGFVILVFYLSIFRMENTVMLSVLMALGALLHVLKVEGSTNRSHYTLSFLVFGFTLIHLGVSEALLVILVSNLAEWIWNKPPWFIQLFNISCYTIAMFVGGNLFHLLNPSAVLNSGDAILALVVGMGGFTIANHFLVGVIVWLARGENFKQSGIFGLTSLLIDLTMITIGASMEIVWQINPYALLIFLLPSYPLYMSLKIPGLERKTETDLKTGLYNHHYFMKQLDHELQRANRYDRPLSLIMADLDLLRNINNTFGHLAGDAVLKEVAEILRQTVREYDLVARFGGEEFAILMPEVEIEKATERAELIRKAVETAKFIVPTSVEPIKVTMSFGISRRENFGQTVTEIIHHADTALYQSKLSGRNATVMCVNDSFIGVNTKNPVQGVSGGAQGDSSTPPALDSGYQAAASSLNSVPKGNSATEQSDISEINDENDANSIAARSHTNVRNYIAILAVGALAGLILNFTLYSGYTITYSPVVWSGFLAIALTLIITEWFSINLYVRNTSLSTSAVSILALVILFGPWGTLAASLLFSLTAAVKFRSRFDRVLFNFSNHVIAGSVINLLFTFNVSQLANAETAVTELGVTLASALILFILTTVLVSIGVGIDLRQSARVIWREQYQWMVPYYIGMGFITYALMFGYNVAGVPGILTLMIPIALLRIGQAQYIEHTREVVSELRQKNLQLERSSAEINNLNEGLLVTLSDIIDLRDPYVLGHSRMVSNYAADIAKTMKLSGRQIDFIRKGGLLHDIGNLGIPTEILTKPTRLTAEEYAIVKSHAELGGDLVKNSPSLRPLVPIIRHHHEHYDGRGYPEGLKGNKIPIEARILAVADAIEAMSSDRPYRRALPKTAIIRELLENSGSQFDPLVVDAALKILDAEKPESQTVLDRTEFQVRISKQLAVQG